MILDFGTRLREERERLGFSQETLGDMAGVVRKSQTNYELGKTAPSASYLARLSLAGVDVAYVLTGRRGPIQGITDADEIELLNRFRAAPADYRRMALGVLGAAPSTALPASGGMQFLGDVGNVNHGAINAPQTFHMKVGGRKKRGPTE
ncbi:helix-turn-helix domain-containing protein [Lysobacter sp. CA199]|uniref:helix-turn-helix domain-containing protein n=1 Tax=Lysobacter sp. CA199 TaxID=3455608 RepID=UPI003F8D3EC7